jgi:hypothetical protein
VPHRQDDHDANRRLVVNSLLTLAQLSNKHSFGMVQFRRFCDGHDLRGRVIRACRFPAAGTSPAGRRAWLPAIAFYATSSCWPSAITCSWAPPPNASLASWLTAASTSAGQTILRWVQKFGPALSWEIRRYRNPLSTTWLVDETNVKILGKCTTCTEASTHMATCSIAAVADHRLYKLVVSTNRLRVSGTPHSDWLGVIGTFAGSSNPQGNDPVSALAAAIDPADATGIIWQRAVRERKVRLLQVSVPLHE